jgi:C-terminal peptidase prc
MQRAVRHLFLWLVLACPVPLCAQNYWPATHLGFDHLKSVALAKCYDDLKELIGCYRAVGGALGSTNDLRLTASEPENGEVVVKSFGILKVVRSPENDAVSSVYQFWQHLIAQRNRDIANLHAQFRDPGAARMDFDEIVAYIRTITPKEEESELAARGINEYFAAVIDPHTQISTRHDLADSINGVAKSYSGVGINVFKLGNRYLITAVNPDGPAFSKGVKINDFLTRVDGRSTTELSTEQLTTMVRGKENTDVTLTLMRDGQSLTVVVARQRISREVVEDKLIKSDRQAYGTIRIQNFMNEKGCEKTALAIQALRARGARGWILDLRGNLGGSISMAVCVAGLFLGPQAFVAYKIDRDTNQRRDYVTTTDSMTSSPLVVLANGSSASGSELLAGALQDNKRGWIVGERTFGKGTTQSIRDFKIPGTTGIIRNETTGLFFLASGRTTQLEGITPDFVVASTPGATEEERFTPREKDAYIAPIPYRQPPWISPRPGEIQKVAACVEHNGTARSRYASSRTQADYQMLYAIDVLDCQ